MSDLDVDAEEGEFVVPAFLGLFAPGECVECVDFAGVVGGGWATGAAFGGCGGNSFLGISERRGG